MNISQIGKNVQDVVKSFSKETFIYDLLRAYGIPKATISRLQKGDLNLSKQVSGEIDWKKKLFFKVLDKEDLHDTIDIIRKTPKYLKHDPRFIIVTDYSNLLAVDRKTEDTLDIKVKEIDRYFDFFLPWAGMEKTQHPNENLADVKAAYRMGKLYDEIKLDTPTHTEAEIHSLNVFLSRLLFCFYAEDTGIFDLGQFTNAIASHTQSDGSDLNKYLDKLFHVLNTDKKHRKNLPVYLEAFHYVNGGLFRDRHSAPIFTSRSRQAIIESGELDWSAINPDIFGSMIQAVISPEHRGGLGMHYTSVPNIMKVIEPLFLNELKQEFEQGKNEPKKLNALLERISNLKIFDPACGSGNFLIIAYKELRQLEIRILQQLQLLQKAATGFEPHQLELIPKAQLTLAKSFQVSLFSRIELSQFYGIELEDFAHEIAILSLWLAQHQMNMRFKEVFGTANPTLPLHAGGNIVHGNATRINWETVCPKIDGDEIYILGNPPYLGSRNQDEIQKEDMKAIFKKDYKSLDYITCWLLKGSTYILNFNAQFAFVSTNSICQGEQVALIWPRVLNDTLEIGFAHQSFKWKNNAKDNAGVTVVIIGIRNKLNLEKRLYFDSKYSKVGNINPYLTTGNFVNIFRRSYPLSDLPECTYGSMPNDGGNLLLNLEEKEKLIKEYPKSQKIIKRFFGTNELLTGQERWCLIINDDDLDLAKSVPEIEKRLENIKDIRKKSSEISTNKMALEPHKFYFLSHKDTDSIIIPNHTSERRDYIPMGFLKSDSIISNSAQAIYNAKPWIFGVITSLMHMTWIRSVCGSLETRIRYSATLGYNTFPFPPISITQKQEIEKYVFSILEERERHSEKSLAKLYDPDKIPKDLKEAHHQLDLAIERCYKSKPFVTDDERLEYLFKLYEQMIGEEKERNGELNFEQPKAKKKKKNYA